MMLPPRWHWPCPGRESCCRSRPRSNSRRSGGLAGQRSLDTSYWRADQLHLRHGGADTQLETGSLFDTPSLALCQVVSRVLVEQVDVLLLAEVWQIPAPVGFPGLSAIRVTGRHVGAPGAERGRKLRCDRGETPRLFGPGIHHMEEVTPRRLHHHSEGDHRLRPPNQPVEISSGDTGTLMQAVDDVAARLDAVVHGHLQGGVLFTCIRQHSCLPLVADGRGGGVLT